MITFHEDDSSARLKELSLIRATVADFVQKIGAQMRVLGVSRYRLSIVPVPAYDNHVRAKLVYEGDGMPEKGFVLEWDVGVTEEEELRDRLICTFL